MNRINEFNFEPGVYKFGGASYVVTGMITHVYNQVASKMEALPDPLVICHDVVPISKLHREYSVNLSIARTEFKQE